MTQEDNLDDDGLEVIEPRKIDEVQLFMLYSLFGGDTKRVSLVSGVSKKRIDNLAHDFLWARKTNGRIRMDTEEGLKIEQALNRVSSYVTAERLAGVFQNLVAELHSDPSFAKMFCTSVGLHGTSFSAKNLVDLAKGLQVVQDVKYRALGDRVAPAAEDGPASNKAAAGVALNLYKAMAQRFDQVLAVDTAEQIVKAVKATADAPEAPETA